MEKKAIIVERLLKASIEEVWEALTNKDEMKKWFFDLKDFKAEVGFQFEFIGGHDEQKQYQHLCVVTDVISQKKISYSWRYVGYSGLSFVTFELFKYEGNTLLKLTHEGLESFPSEDPVFALQNFETGWKTIINNSLKNYLEMENYQSTITLDAENKEVYESIINIPLWWTEMLEGTAAIEGEKFTVRFGHSVFKTIVVEELIPNKKIVWNVIDNYSDIPELNNKSEWIGTKIIWTISAKQNKTSLELTHIGLTPQVECYTICERGWQNFTDSLRALINTGIGNPFKMQTA